MKFVNNWFQVVTLAAGVNTLALDLEDGEYRLTLADDDVAATRWEVVAATVASGTATLQRGQEGTTDQDWPDGSLIYIDVTAGWLNSVETRLANLPSGGAIIANAPPGENDVPGAVGMFYSVPGTAIWVANGTEFGSDWMALRGLFGAGFSYNSALPGSSYTAPYAARRLNVDVAGAFTGAFPATLVMPWIGHPYGLEIEIVPGEADAIALTMDFSAMGDQGYMQIENAGVANVTLTGNGNVFTVTVDQHCMLTLNSHWREAGEFGLDFRLEPAVARTYLMYPE